MIARLLSAPIMSYFNRLAAILDGCPDPGGVLYRQAPMTNRPGGVPFPRRMSVPKVSELVLPGPGVTAPQLAEFLGLPVFVVRGEFVKLGLFFPHDAPLDHAAIRQLCSRLGVTVIPAA